MSQWQVTYEQFEFVVLVAPSHMFAGADGSWISLLPSQLPVQDGVLRASKPHPFHDKMQVEAIAIYLHNGDLVHNCIAVYLGYQWVCALYLTGAQRGNGK